MAQSIEPSLRPRWAGTLLHADKPRGMGSLSRFNSASKTISKSTNAVAHMLSDAMDEAAVWITRCNDRERALAQAQEALASMLDGFLA